MPQDNHELQTEGGSATALLSPVSPIPRLDLLIEAGRFDEAETVAAEISRSDGRGAGLLERMARLAERRGAWRDALGLWEELAEALPNSPLPIVGRADVLCIIGDADAAETALERLPPACLDHVHVLACRARLATAQRDWDRALAFWRQVQSRDPRALNANIGVVRALIERQDLSEAVEELLRLPPDQASDPAVLECHAHILSMRGDWDGCLDVLRHMLFSPAPSEWAMHQVVWILVELRRFGALRNLNADLARSGYLNPRLRSRIERALQQAAEFEAATQIALRRWPSLDLSIKDMVVAVTQQFQGEDRLLDAAEWFLYSLYPNNLDVLLMMANPARMIPLSENRTYYFRRLVMLRYPASQAALRQHVYNLYSVKQYEEVLSSVEAHGLARVSDAAIVQIYLSSRDIVAPGEAGDRMVASSGTALPAGFLNLLEERDRNAGSLQGTPTRRPVVAARPRPRIALCISGQLRGYARCFGSLQRHVIERYDTRVFVHTWSKVGNALGSHGGRLHRMLPDEVAAEIPTQWSDEDFFARYPTAKAVLHAEVRVSREELSEFMHPAACFIEDEAAFEALASHLELADHRSVMNQYKLFFQMSKCLEKAGLSDPARWNDYDLVIWMRPDIKLPRMRVEPLLRDCLDGDFIVTSFLPPLGVGDFTMIGTPVNMSALASIWPRIMTNGYQDARFSIQGFGPTLLCNHLFRLGRKVKHTDMFVAHDAGPHGARPNSMELLSAMLRDLALRPDWLPFETGALNQLVGVCRAESKAEPHQAAVTNVVRSAMVASPNVSRNLAPLFSWL